MDNPMYVMMVRNCASALRRKTELGKIIDDCANPAGLCGHVREEWADLEGIDAFSMALGIAIGLAKAQQDVVTDIINEMSGKGSERPSLKPGDLVSVIDDNPDMRHDNCKVLSVSGGRVNIAIPEYRTLQVSELSCVKVADYHKVTVDISRIDPGTMAEPSTACSDWAAMSLPATGTPLED